jgi:dihydroflavonol-4-reductase
MKVLVTGGTGFVGSHTVRALLAAGHQVRLLARDRARAAIRGVELAGGDVTDKTAVERAVAGCEAVLHGASVYSFLRSRHAEMRRINVAGTRVVLEAGLAAGCNPVVHISSALALLGGSPRGAVLTADSPLDSPLGVYARTKRDSDAVARELQASGHPVVITYPGAVWGPEDPYLGESCQLALHILKGHMPLTSKGRFCIADVRDVASVHARAMKPHDGPRRYPALGQGMRFCDVHDAVCRAAGVRRANIPVPDLLVAGNLPFFWLMSVIAPGAGMNVDGPYVSLCNHTADNSVSERELGVTFRPADESIRDTVQWLKAAGHLPA